VKRVISPIVRFSKISMLINAISAKLVLRSSEVIKGMSVSSWTLVCYVKMPR